MIINKVFNADQPQHETASTSLKIIDEVINPIIDVKKELPVVQVNDSDSVTDFKFIKAEMKRLGFDSYEEYEEYLEFLKHKKQQRK